MDGNLSPLVQENLEKLEMDAESRRLAMKYLKSYAKSMDTKAIPQFIAQISETNNQGSPSRECRISLCEVLVRVHGRNIVPQIGSIMNTIIRTLSTSALHYACSRVVLAIARYGIVPSLDDEKKMIILSLTTPLSGALMSSHESLASGSALCLQALVESGTWEFASDDTIEHVCLKVADALKEKITQTDSHMCLAMALAKHNSANPEAYVGCLIRSGLHLLSAETAENNSHERFAAIQMINFFMKCIDSRSISSAELADIFGAMEKCKADHIPYVKGAAFEALQTAKAVASQKGSKCEPTDDSDSLHSDITTDAEEIRQSIESVSSTADPDEDKVYEMIGISADAELKGIQINGRKLVWYRKSILVFVFGLAMIFLAIIMSIQRDDDDKFSYGLVPT